MNTVLPWLALLAWSSASAASPDYNGLGMRAMADGNYGKALGYFEKELEKSPKNAYAWLNKGRATALFNREEEPADYCDLDSNWVFAVLSYLDRAMKLSPGPVGRTLAADSSAFAFFKRRPEYAGWNKAFAPFPVSDADLAAFIRANPEWSRLPEGGGKAETLVFEKGGKVFAASGGEKKDRGVWAAGAGAVSVKHRRWEAVRYKLAVREFPVMQGRGSFRRLYLEGGGESWALGAASADCQVY